MILVDTSDWIDLIRTGKASAEARDRLLDNVTCGPVLQEILQGGDDHPEWQGFTNDLLSMPSLDDPLPLEAFVEAAAIYRSGRRRGYTIRSTVDCLIAAIAIRHKARVWHKDRDFDAIARYTELRTITQFPS